MAGIQPSSRPTASGANDKPDGSLKHTLHQQNQSLLLSNDSAILECNTSGVEDGWTVQGDVKIEVHFLACGSCLLWLLRHDDTDLEPPMEDKMSF